MNLKFFGICLALLMVSRPACAVVVTYDAASGLFPESVGWQQFAPPNPENEVSNNGIVLKIVTTEQQNDVGWGFDMTAKSDYASGMFMEVNVKLVSEMHTRDDRGLYISGMRNGNEATNSAHLIDVWAQENNIVIWDGRTELAANIPFDPTDGFHTYRLESFPGGYQFFIDSTLAFANTFGEPKGPASEFDFPLVIRGGSWGAGSNFSQSSSRWATVTIGSLVDVGGPTIIPEPTAALFLCGSGALACLRRRRRGFANRIGGPRN